MMNTVLDAACGSIMVPKVLAIKNRRLGLLFRVLQLGTVFWVLFNSIAMRAWLITSVPMPLATELWITFPSASEEAAMETPAYCDDPSSVNYAYSSSYSFEYSGCERLPEGERVSKSGTSLFVPFSFTDTYNEQALGAAECGALEASCDAIEGAVFETFSGGACGCKQMVQRLAKDAEQVRLHFNHGYQAHFSTGERLRGRDKLQLESSSGANSDWEEEEGNEGELATIIRKEDGTRCKVGAHMPGGARALWDKQAVSVDGISGSVGEWLACAGISLDDPVRMLKSGLASEVGEPTTRVTGLELVLGLTYYNSEAEGHDIEGFGTVCYVTVSVNPQWNSMYSMSYSTVPHPTTGAGSYRFRNAYGLGLKMETKGRIAKFDYTSAINMLVSALVLLSLPGAIIQFLAMNCCGLFSKFYKRAHMQILQISDVFTGLSARMLTATAAFSAFVGAEPGDELQDHPMDATLVKKGLRQAMSEEFTNGRLSDTEFDILVASVLKDLDKADDGSISVDEFLRAFSSTEFVSPQEMAQLFDKDRRRGILEKIFTSSTLASAESSTRKRQVKPGKECEGVLAQNETE